MNTRLPSYFSPLHFTVVLVIMLLLGLQFTALMGNAEGTDAMTKSINNCRHIVMAIKIYASDNNGDYPDAKVPSAKNSNEVFRVCFRERFMDEESMFGCENSPFRPDGDIGDARNNFARAVEAGENHWALTKGLDESTPGIVPLVFENPVDASWPPGWDADLAGESVKGRSWTGGRIIVGLNDGSVHARDLSAVTGAKVHLSHRSDPFTIASQADNAPKYEMLDVAVKKP